MADINKALSKHSIGDGLTDGELSTLTDLFTRMESDLGRLSRHYNAGFGLAHKAALRELQVLESFRDARERR